MSSTNRHSANEFQLSDGQARGAQIINGKMRGESIRKLHENVLQSLGKTSANLNQKGMKEIFFPKFKSPQKSMTSIASAESKNC